MVRSTILMFLAILPAIAFAGRKYTPQMYEKAIAPDTVVVEKTVVVRDTVVIRDTVVVRDTVTVRDTVAVRDTANVVTEKQKPVTVEVVAAPIPVKSEYKDEEGKALSLQYHIVVGSFQEKLNAQNLVDQIMQTGNGSPSIAIAPDGKFRVFYFSSNDEAEARKVLSQIKDEYQSAWLLNLKK